MCVLMCNFVSYFVCVILCIFVFLCDILLPSGVINDDWVLEWFYSPRAVGTTLSEVHALRAPSALLVTVNFV